MNICDLRKGEHAVVLKVEHDGDLKDRLIALGIYNGAKIVLLKRTILGHGYLVQAGSSRVAMAREIASGVRIWRI